MNFASDNTAGIAPEILKALAAGTEGSPHGYVNRDVPPPRGRAIVEVMEADGPGVPAKRPMINPGSQSGPTTVHP